MPTPDPQPLVDALRRLDLVELNSYARALAEVRDDRPGRMADVYHELAVLAVEVRDEIGRPFEELADRHSEPEPDL
jgi:hypothetical protein